MKQLLPCRRHHNVRFLPPFDSCVLMAVYIITASPDSSWKPAQILVPVLIGIVLCLTFALYLLHQSGRLSRLTSILPSMRRSRQRLTPRRWSFGDDTPGSGTLRHAEATPMIDPFLHWRSLSPHDDDTDRQRPSIRMRMGVLTPAFSKAIHSIRRLFRWGPIQVSHVPVPDTFDLEDPVTETDTLKSDTLRSNESKSWGLPTLGRNPGLMMDRIPSMHDLVNKTSWSSAALDSVLDDDRGNYEDIGKNFEDGGANDHDYGMDAQHRVMLISRNGEDFSVEGSPISRKTSIEVDRRSTEVVPPTPTIRKQVNGSQQYDPRATRDHLTSRPFHRRPSLARSVSSPDLCPSSSERSLVRPFTSSTNNLPDLCAQPLPKPPFKSPTPFSTRPTPLSSVYPSREDAPGVHYRMTGTPPAGLNAYLSPEMGSTLTFPLPPDTHSRFIPAGYSPSPSPSPDLQSYIPTFLRRSPPGSLYPLPSPAPSSMIHASDLQNLIPSAVRGAGYNPFRHARHARSVSAFE